MCPIAVHPRPHVRRCVADDRATCACLLGLMSSRPHARTCIGHGGVLKSALAVRPVRLWVLTIYTRHVVLTLVLAYRHAARRPPGAAFGVLHGSESVSIPWDLPSPKRYPQHHHSRPCKRRWERSSAHALLHHPQHRWHYRPPHSNQTVLHSHSSDGTTRSWRSPRGQQLCSSGPSAKILSGLQSSATTPHRLPET